MMCRRMKGTPTKNPKVTKEDIYKMLISRYKWTFDTIANLNIWQQMIALGADVGSLEEDIIEFATEADYLRWKANL